MDEGHNSGRDSRARRKVANQRFSEIEGDLRGYTGRCLFVIDDSERFCDEPVRNISHLVPEEAVLKPLRGIANRVLQLDWGVSQWRELFFRADQEAPARDATIFDPSERTTEVACTGRFVCKALYHDDEYNLIDGAHPDFDIPEVPFLTALRLDQFGTDQIRQALELHQKWTPDFKSRPRSRRENIAWNSERMKLTRVKKGMEATVRSLGRHWHARKTGGTFDLSIVSARVLTFRSKLRLAGGVFYGGATSVYAFPVQDDLHRMVIHHLTNQSDRAQMHVECLEEVARASEEDSDYGVIVTKELMTRGWGSLAVAPQSYEELNEEDRTTIRELVERHSGIGEMPQPSYRQPFGRRRRGNQRFR